MGDDRPSSTIPAEEIPQPPPKQLGAAAGVRLSEFGIQLQTLDELIRFARLVVEGGAAPSWAYGGKDEHASGAGNRAAGAVAVAIQAGMEHGLGYLGGLQAFIVLDGHITWKGEAAAGKIRTSKACVPGSLEFGCAGEGDKRVGWATAWRVGDRGPSRIEFTYQHARQADLLGKKNWRTYPERMFQWRALAWLAKDKFSDVLGGFPLAEEVADYDEVRVRREAPQPDARVSRALPPSSVPDPLFATLGLEKPAESRPVEFAKASDTEIPLEDAAPFRSHEEADKAIADAEGQGRLKL